MGGTLLRGTLPVYPAGGGYPARGYPSRVLPQPGQDRGYPARGYPAGGYPSRVPSWPGQDREIPCQRGYPGRVPPSRVPLGPGRDWGGTQLGQQKEYSLHGGRYASCVHAGGLSCLILYSIGDIHIIFWLSFNCVNFPFAMCIFASNANFAHFNLYFESKICPNKELWLHFVMGMNILFRATT